MRGGDAERSPNLDNPNVPRPNLAGLAMSTTRKGGGGRNGSSLPDGAARHARARRRTRVQCTRVRFCASGSVHAREARMSIDAIYAINAILANKWLREARRNHTPQRAKCKCARGSHVRPASRDTRFRTDALTPTIQTQTGCDHAWPGVFPHPPWPATVKHSRPEPRPLTPCALRNAPGRVGGLQLHTGLQHAPTRSQPI